MRSQSAGSSESNDSTHYQRDSGNGFTLKCVELDLRAHHDSVVVSSKLPNTNLEVISKNNLETSGVSNFVFVVRLRLLFKRPRRPLYVARFLRQLIDYIYSRNLQFRN